MPRASFLGSRLVVYDSNSREGNLEKLGAVTVAAILRGEHSPPDTRKLIMEKQTTDCPVLFSFLKKTHLGRNFNAPFNAEALFSEEDAERLVQEIGPVANIIFETSRENRKHIAKQCLPLMALFYGFVREDNPTVEDALNIMIMIHTQAILGNIH